MARALQFADSVDDLLEWEDDEDAPSIFEFIRETLENSETLVTLDFDEGEDAFYYAPPIEAPQKIICIGLNYADHAKEFKDEIPSEPVIFNKFPSALNAHLGEIELPPVSDRVDYEGELVVVIGKTGKDIAREDAMDYVAGYCCGNDVSARDWQKGKPAGQWLLGKSFDTFAPIGPC
ncbi:MAG: fumarylacetoacetate hydrolase family protein, partial [Thermoguttaceae bacterium]|nr:fumarylacetoacetate hydrolase family protein [Thermoguttaceae bacterium]